MGDEMWKYAFNDTMFKTIRWNQQEGWFTDYMATDYILEKKAKGRGNWKRNRKLLCMHTSVEDSKNWQLWSIYYCGGEFGIFYMYTALTTVGDATYFASYIIHAYWNHTGTAHCNEVRAQSSVVTGIKTEIENKNLLHAIFTWQLHYTLWLWIKNEHG